jgi:hypothetical protein
VKVNAIVFVGLRIVFKAVPCYRMFDRIWIIVKCLRISIISL